MKKRIYLSAAILVVFVGVLFVPTRELEFNRTEDPRLSFESNIKSIDISPEFLSPESESIPNNKIETESNIQIQTPVIKDESNVKLEFSLGKNTKLTISFGSLSSIVLLWSTYLIPLIKGKFFANKK